MSFVDDVNNEQERNSPVRAAVKDNAADIQAARKAGKPINAIFRTLKRKGQPVGKGPSSFRNAVRYLDEHGWPEAVAAHSPVLAPAPVPQAADHAARDRFADHRFDSDF